MTPPRAATALLAVLLVVMAVVLVVTTTPADPVPILEQLCVEARAAHPDRGCP